MDISLFYAFPVSKRDRLLEAAERYVKVKIDAGLLSAFK